MFKCQGCKQTQSEKIRPHRVVAEKREQTYKEGTRGWEIVREVNLCDKCYKGTE